MKIISWISVVFGCLLLISFFSPEAFNKIDNLYYAFSIALSFLILGSLGLEYVRKNYQGEIPSIIGAILVTLSLQFLVLSLEQFFLEGDSEIARGGLLASMIFMIPGIALVRYGHKIHLSKQ